LLSIKLGLLGVVVLGLMGEPVALSGLHSLLGVLPGPPELHALLVGLVCVKGQCVFVIVNAAKAAFPEELVVRISIVILLGLWWSGDNALRLLRLACRTYHL